MISKTKEKNFDLQLSGSGTYGPTAIEIARDVSKNWCADVLQNARKKGFVWVVSLRSVCAHYAKVDQSNMHV